MALRIVSSGAPLCRCLRRTRQREPASRLAEPLACPGSSKADRDMLAREAFRFLLS